MAEGARDKAGSGRRRHPDKSLTIGPPFFTGSLSSQDPEQDRSPDTGGHQTLPPFSISHEDKEAQKMGS